MKTLVALSVIAIGVGICAAADQSPQNITGTWNLNVNKSSWGKKLKPQSSTVHIEHNEPALKYSGTVVNATGEPNTNFEFEGAIDGKPYPVKTPSGDGTRVYKRVDAHTVTAETKSNDGKFVETARNTVSKDGKVLTRKIQVKGPQGNSSWTEVYEKQL